MKKFILFVLITFTMLFVSSLAAYASDVGDVIENVTGGGFATFAALVALTVSVTGVVKTIFKGLDGVIAVIVSWVMGIVITIAGWLLCLGFLCGLVWWEMLLYGFAASLAANGIFDFSSLSGLLDTFIKKKE